MTVLPLTSTFCALSSVISVEIVRKINKIDTSTIKYQELLNPLHTYSDVIITMPNNVEYPSRQVTFKIEPAH